MASSNPNTKLGVDRNTFMKAVRRALGGKTAGPVTPPRVDEQVARLAQADDDLQALFTQKAGAVGMQVQKVLASELPQRTLELCEEHGASRVVLAAAKGSLAAKLQPALGEKYELVDWQTQGLDPQFDAEVGVTDVHAGLAETGTLVCSSDAEHTRGASLVPPVHIAVILASQIVPDMLDYWRSLGKRSPQELPSSQSLITGPSKTADIEGQLVTGVHGPGAVHILLVVDA